MNFNNYKKDEQKGIICILKKIEEYVKTSDNRQILENDTSRLKNFIDVIQFSGINSDRILEEILGEKEFYYRISNQIVKYLKPYFTIRQLQKICTLNQDNQKKQRSTSIHRNTQQQILDNIPIIQEELEKMKISFETIGQLFCSENLLSQDSIEKIKNLSLKNLIALLEDELVQNISEEFNDFIFRLSILEESITLIIQKSLKLLKLAITKDEEEQDLKSQNGSNNEFLKHTSSLSQSILIYKKNKKAEEQILMKSLKKRQYTQTTKIRTDYQIKTKKKQTHTHQYGNKCCIC